MDLLEWQHDATRPTKGDREKHPLLRLETISQADQQSRSIPMAVSFHGDLEKFFTELSNLSTTAKALLRS